ncbi:MAG: response regulator [Actinomycetota bacterium]|nr:response regulator [Actinomycetota bacterium]
MPDILIASDAEWVRDDIKAVLTDPETTVREVTRGYQVRPAVQEKTPDLAILDLQIGKMGGMATCLDLRLEEGAGRLPHVPVLMLLDRRADVFLARRAKAEGWVVKPLDPMRLSRAIQTVLAGGRYEDEAYRPPTVPVKRAG